MNRFKSFRLIAKTDELIKRSIVIQYRYWSPTNRWLAISESGWPKDKPVGCIRGSASEVRQFVADFFGETEYHVAELAPTETGALARKERPFNLKSA